MDAENFSEVLSLAIEGDRQAIEVILRMYMPLIRKNSRIDGVFNEDCQQYIMMQVARQIGKFKA